jgi:hypothetical protein
MSSNDYINTMSSNDYINTMSSNDYKFTVYAHMMPGTSKQRRWHILSGLDQVFLTRHLIHFQPFKVAARVRIPLGVQRNSW